MQCTKCKYPDSRVVSTDHNDRKNLIQRRRECLKCGVRFTTYEQLRDPLPILEDRYAIGAR
jgi:transcriptional repressor NrdR